MLRIMIRIALALAGATLLAVPAHAAERRYSITDFDRIVVEGPFVVRLVTGRPTSAVATGPQAAIERLSVDAQGQTLRIRPNRNAWGNNDGSQQGALEITLTTRTLRSARVIGPGRLDVTGVQGLRAELALDGSGRLEARGIAADNLVVASRGSGAIHLAGRAGTVRADIQGSGDLAASALTSQNLTLTAATTGTVALTASDTARVTAAGVGEVEIAGRAACTVTGLGASRVRCGQPARGLGR